MATSRILLTSLALLAGMLLVPHVARAAQSYDTCTGFIDSLPATINSQGTWCLRGNVSTAITSGEAIEVAANNVTIDCNGFKIGGLGGGVATRTWGIAANERFNLKVTNCNIRGFYYGIRTSGGGGHVVENNTLDGNTAYGIAVYGGPGTIRGNVVVDTGGSSQYPTAVGIYASQGVNVIDNTVSGVLAGTGGSVYAIYTHTNSLGVVQDNRVTGMAGESSVVGIYNYQSGRVVVRDNVVIGPGSTGIICASNQSTSANNVISGFNTGVMHCESVLDVINAN